MAKKVFHIKQNSLRAWILAARPKTLSGAAVPVMIGTALACADVPIWGIELKIVPVVLCFLFAFAMQIDANFINDLLDCLNGTDSRAPRLGPPRTCTVGWITTSAMKKGIILTTVIACLCGLPLIYYGGWAMILIGVACVVFSYLYTSHLAGRGLGDVLVLVFFGIVPVCLTYYLQFHKCTAPVFLSSLACGLVVDGMLIVNNFRDRYTDEAVGKKTLAVMLGSHATMRVFLWSGYLACLLQAIAFITYKPFAGLLPIVYLSLHVGTFRATDEIYEGRDLNMCLAWTARNIFVYGVVVCIGVLM